MIEKICGNAPDKHILVNLSKFRLGVITSNPIRTWQFDDGVRDFKRGGNFKEGIYMGRLTSVTRHLFYDHMTHPPYTLDGVLKRQKAVCEDEDFIKLLTYEWDNNIFYGKNMPESLENMAMVYKYLIQNVIEPLINDNDYFTHLKNVFLSTFDVLKNLPAVDNLDANTIKMYEKQELKGLNDFRHNLKEIRLKLEEHKPKQGKVLTEKSDFTCEINYSSSAHTAEAIEMILNGSNHYEALKMLECK
jgi:hypothetical protein